MNNINKVILAEIISILFFITCYFVFWVFSVSYIFDFTQYERKNFSLISATSLFLMFPTPIFLALYVRRRNPEFRKNYARFKKQIKSLKKIQKIGLLLAISGLILLAISYIVPKYLDFFYGFIPFKQFFIIFLDAIPFLFSIGLTLFYLFFGLKKIKNAKTWSDLFKEEES